jgi:hypothetical protein
MIQATCKLYESAYHEAGHAVIAHEFNLCVNHTRVVWDPERNRWGGGTLATPRLDGSDLGTQIPVIAASKVKESLAGMLALAKFMASQQLGTDLLKFNLSMAEFGDLWPLLKGRKKTEESPGLFHLEFVRPDGSIQSLRFEASVCLISDADITNYNCYVNGHQLGRRPTESAEELVVETMRLLDNEACWNGVRTVAMALVNGGQGRCLREDELIELLELSGARASKTTRLRSVPRVTRPD